jgi:tetratricopeptide (TPR) repeat protein
MTMERQSVKLIFIVIVLFFLSIPVAAYSNEAVNSYNQGNAFIAAGNLTEAAAAYQHAINVSPDYYEAWNGLADVLNRDRQYSKALIVSNISLSINSSYSDAWINRGLILYNLGYVYQNQLNDSQTADEMYNLQLQAFNNAITVDPTNAEAWFNKGYALGGLKRYDEAIAAFDQVKALDPNYPNLVENRQIAVELRDAAEPFYIRYAFPLVIGVIACLGIIGWYIIARKKSTD